MNVLQMIGYAGTFVFALTGALKARTYKMDIFGGLVLAFVTAYGGGTLRVHDRVQCSGKRRTHSVDAVASHLPGSPHYVPSMPPARLICQ